MVDALCIMVTHLTLCVAVIWTLRDWCIQVAVNGDLANWHTGKADDVPAVGGAMDLAVGAKRFMSIWSM